MTTRNTRRNVETTDDEMLVYESSQEEDFALELDRESIVGIEPESGTTVGSPLDASYDQRLQAAQEQLLQLRQQQEAIERQKRELEELNQKQRTFVSGRNELSNNFSRSIGMLEREATEARKRADQFDATRETFEHYFEAINALKPETWNRARLRDELGQALSLIEDASEEYEKQIAKTNSLRGSNSAESRTSNRSNSSPSMDAASGASFKEWFMMGLAFTLPVTALGILALLVSLFF